MTAYRFHIARNRDDDADETGRLFTLCNGHYPDAYVFNEPIDGQPMCTKCIKRWESKVVACPDGGADK